MGYRGMVCEIVNTVNDKTDKLEMNTGKDWGKLIATGLFNGVVDGIFIGGLTILIVGSITKVLKKF